VEVVLLGRLLSTGMSERPQGINNILLLAALVCQRLAELEVPYCLIGGVANQRWGEPRQTLDVDGTVIIGFGQERHWAQKLATVFASRIENAADFAIQNRIVLLRSDEGLGIDLSLGALPYEERMVARASDWDVPAHGRIRTCAAEDLIVLKAFASRAQDWIDIEKVLIRRGDKLDRELIVEELTPLVELKEEPEILHRLQTLMKSKH
jgi:hypothetical protein